MIWERRSLVPLRLVLGLGLLSLIAPAVEASPSYNAINLIPHVVSGLNDSGQNVVWHGFIAGSQKATDLGTLGGSSSSIAAINDSGQVVGQSATSSGNVHAFL